MPRNPPPSELSIMIVAGEASGDRHGASLAQALTSLCPETRLELFGSGGDEMRAAGVEALVDARDVAIIGVPEVARAIGKLYRAYRTLLHAARSRRPAAVVLIDWPDFNMRLARKLHREGFKIIYYVSPQVWAWRRYRVRALRRDVDRMLVILPFEEEFYKNAGIDVEYVGHPLAGVVRASVSREEFCRRHGLDPTRSIFALLPGSRNKEIHYHLPLMLDAATRLQTSRLRIADCGSRIEGSVKIELRETAIRNPQSAPEIDDPQFVIPLASTVRREQVQAIIQKVTLEGKRAGTRSVNVAIVERDTYNALSHSAFAIVASGTATVEAALAGTPMVIIYRGSELNWRLLRPLIHLDTFGMVNLIAGRRIVPELIQHDATGERIAQEVRAILENEPRRIQMKQDLAQVRELLAASGSTGAERAARAVIDIIGRR
ncbi:MAG TPA: lipid-A-disaccharide synthase [Blastocatellia bacterium]|nr:lipid-A-disaccharide synthase [Blastocatellia bacterium]